MRRLLFTALLAACLLPAATPDASAQGRQNFSLFNRTGYQINELFIAPSRSDTWSDDLLAHTVLPDQGSVAVTFSAPSSECFWDIKVVYDDGDEGEFSRVNLCRISRVSLFWNRQAGETRFIAE